VMVLDAGQLQPAGVRQPRRVAGRQVIGMQVVRDDLRLDAEQPLEVLDPLGERAQRLGVL